MSTTPHFVPGRGASVGDPVFASSEFMGLHFTGSTETFQRMWGTIAGNLARYKGYPRIVGETGGKDFVFAHPSADARALVVALVRGSFEYQGQKCSAASRAYVPASLWKQSCRVRRLTRSRAQRSSTLMAPPPPSSNSSRLRASCASICLRKPCKPPAKKKSSISASPAGMMLASTGISRL